MRRLYAGGVDIDLDALVTDWLSIPEAADLLGVEQRQVRSLVRDRRLVAVRRGSNDALGVPAAFLVTTTDDDGAATRVLPPLRGSLIQLGDAGYDDAEAVRWLFTHEESLDARPVDALRAGRASAVRRAAQSLAF
ncbi:conserved hypothetical protein [Beutenbergia cavernae DSM 12333]|uniref:Uncharacterized protein n=1 Tax=Beutenbergia cavernae (strain ATCC BAA-8 / DSM 12333 / CCUG 43141 / JCM 11478 / NBRC 16432 / NCIMB 13614 / HKI 0122) TaxID=471853 RepID=C5C5H4_BEUC1|nr:conserved hypothetical protein [Beutenbergia cavernae DSM 12333]